jgi:hypothetical protein
VTFVEGFDLKVFLQPLKTRTDQHTRLDDLPDLEFIETAA